MPLPGVQSFADVPASVSSYHDKRAPAERCVICDKSPVVHRLRIRLDEYDVPRPDTCTMKPRIHAGSRKDGIAEYWFCDECGNKPMAFELRHNEDGDSLSVVHLLGIGLLGEAMICTCTHPGADHLERLGGERAGCLRDDCHCEKFTPKGDSA